MVHTTRFDENSDLSIIHLGKTRMARDSKVKAEETFPNSGQGYTLRKFLDYTDCQILLDTGTSKSYLSKSFYLRCKTFHTLPKFASNTQRIQVRNGQYVGLLFVIPVTVDIHGHRFEVFTLVSKTYENVDLVLGIKNIFILEGVIDSCQSCFDFMNNQYCSFQNNKSYLNQKNKNLL